MRPQTSLNQPRQSPPSGGKSSALSLFIIAGAVAVMLFLGSNSHSQGSTNCSPSQTDCPPGRQYQIAIYGGFATGDDTSRKFAQYAFYDISRLLPPRTNTNIDLLIANSIENIHSGTADVRGLRQLHDRFQTRPSTDLALIQTFNRVRELVKSQPTSTLLKAYIVTPGTLAPNTLSKIKAIANEIASYKTYKLELYVMGLKQANKIQTIAALHPIATSLAGSCVDDYTLCRPLIDRLAQ
jgi:hypothetical protein